MGDSFNDINLIKSKIMIKQINLLIFIITKEWNLQSKYKQNMQGESCIKNIHIKDINIVGTITISSSEINLINKTLFENKELADVLIADENQIIDDEYVGKLLQVLYFCERHGAAVSLNMYSQGMCHITEEKYKKIAQYFSDYRVVPKIDSLPVLIKAEMFERFGLLDESFQSIQNALADFSLRFNQYGWSVVRANYWNNANRQDEGYIYSDNEIIQKRYPYIHQIEEIYYVREQKAAEHFASVLVLEKEQKPKLLISIYEVPPSYNGTANYALKLLEAFWDSYHEKYEISILAKKNTVQFHQLYGKYPRLFYPEDVRQQTFHIGFIVSQILSADHMDIINRCCLKYSICILDIICLRSHYLCKNDLNRFDLFRDSIEYSDLMLSISRFSHDDITSFFHDEMQNAHFKTGYIYLAADKTNSDKEKGHSKHGIIRSPYQENDYFIIIGNPYRHKMIEPVLGILKDIDENFIVVGTKTEGYCDKAKRIYGYVSGWLDADSLNDMIAASKCIIFPSVYEGFGLTLYDAVVYQKKIIVSDTEVNLELKMLLKDYADQIITYRQGEELKQILTKENFHKEQTHSVAVIKKWSETAKDLEVWIDQMQKEQIDIKQLERRWKYLKRYQKEGTKDSMLDKAEKRKAFYQKCISCFPRTYKLYRRLVVAIDKEHYGNH